MIKGWKYYNHALISTCAPHEVPDLSVIKDGSAWKKLGGAKLFWRDGHRNMTMMPIQTGGILCMIVHMSSKNKRNRIKEK